MQQFRVQAADGFPLSVTLFEPEQCIRRLLLINSATGVRQQFYYAFAADMAAKGFTVLTYDYRGIGQSKPLKMRGFPATMRDWGTKDFSALSAFIEENYRGYKSYMLGHSVGALILGMNEKALHFRKLIFVATQNAWFGHLEFRTKVMGLLGFGILQPVLTRFLGYFPAHLFGLGESLPAGCAADWRTLIIRRESTSALLKQNGADISAHFAQRVLVLSAEDDGWITAKGVQSLLQETYPRLNAVHREIKVHESPAGQIGHINFFRSYNKNLWSLVSEELLKDE